VVYQMTQGMLAEFGMEPAKRGSKMIHESGQYRNAVASGELRHIINSLDHKAHPTLPRSGTDLTQLESSFKLI